MKQHKYKHIQQSNKVNLPIVDEHCEHNNYGEIIKARCRLMMTDADI